MWGVHGNSEIAWLHDNQAPTRVGSPRIIMNRYRVNLPSAHACGESTSSAGSPHRYVRGDVKPRLDRLGGIYLSYDIYLRDPGTGQPVEVDRHLEGGTYAIGGTTEAHLNVTWNYAFYYYAHLDEERGIRWLYEKPARQCIGRLIQAIDAIEADAESERIELERLWGMYRQEKYHANMSKPSAENYWTPTREHAIAPLKVLLHWAIDYPDAVFDGD